MKKRIPITPTLQALQNLPIEVSFQQVEQWVNDAPLFEYQPKSWWNWLLSRRNKEGGN